MAVLNKVLSATVLCAALVPAAASSATLDGLSVNAQWRFPAIGNTYTNYGDAVVGSGLEYTNINVDGVIFFDVDISDTSITVSFNPSSSGFTPASFNGLFITDLSNSFPALTVASVVASGFTFLATDVIFEANGFGLNFSNDIFQGGESVTVNFLSDIAPIPLPATLPLFLAAMGGLVAFGRRRRAA